MYTMSGPPSEAVQGSLGCAGEGTVAARGGGDDVRLFAGALHALQECAEGKYPAMRLAVASSADTPLAVQCAKKSLSMLEVLPGLTFAELLARDWPDGFEGNIQIGRSPPLSSNKTSHFTLLQKNTGIAFNRMLFFDDCGWSDNCEVVERGCPGVTTFKTPRGMQKEEWYAGLAKYATNH